MSATTAIQWADATFNPWAGCTRVSPACDNCYAAASPAARFLGVQWGAGEPRRLSSDWTLPRRLQRKAERTGVRPRLFCASLADIFDNEVPDEWRGRLFAEVAATPNVNWLLLTKRVGNAPAVLPRNVWLGATVVTQREVERDVPKLLARDATVRFLSCEPMLEPLNLRPYLHGLHWVVCGGESGPKHRAMPLGWARNLREQCAAAGVPYFFKQVSARRPDDGMIPDDLRVRQFPGEAP